MFAPAIVGLDQRTHCITATFYFNDARRGADATFKAVADHPRTATDIAFGHWAAFRIGHRRQEISLGKVEGVDIVEPAVVGLGHHGQ